jgi:hypothetical protein
MANAKSTTRPQGERKVRTYRAEGGALAHRLAVMQGTDDDQAKAVTGAGVACVGVIAENAGAAAAGDLISVVEEGETIGIAGGGITPNIPVGVDANGKLVAVTGTDTNIVGISRNSAAADTDEFVVQVALQPKRS